MPRFAIHTSKGWFTGPGFSDHYPSAQCLDDEEEQKRKAHRMIEQGMEAKVVPAKLKVMQDISLLYANCR